MVILDRQIPVAAPAREARVSLLASLRSRLGRWIGRWLGTCGDYYAASAHYEDMARLSDAELKRRGFDRETLAREICDRCERRD